jgi:MFS family permease
MESTDTRDHRSLGDLWSEVGNQVTGSDIESGYSYVYTWLANQFGHFMIGFAGTILFGWLVIFAATALAPISGVDYQWRWPWAGVVVALAWFVLWVLKEWLLDVAKALRDVHFAKGQREDLANNKPIKAERPKHVWPYWAKVLATLRNYYITQHKPKSPVEWFEFDVVRDSQMDMSCYLLGMLTALAMYFAPRLATMAETPPLTGWIPLLVLFVVLIGLAHLSKEWLWANIVFDRAQLPFVSRFVLITRPYDKDTRARALKFATARTDPGHLVIIGPPKSGRTTTAVALGVEALL